MDEQEMDRIDMAHAKYITLLENKLFLAPIGDSPQKVLDLACGTGIWTLDFADMHPSADVSVSIVTLQSKIDTTEGHGCRYCSNTTTVVRY